MTEIANKYIAVITDRYFKLTNAIPTMKTAATRTVNIFMENWVVNVDICWTVLADNAPQSTSKFIAALCKELGVKTVTINKHLPKANWQVDCFNATMISRQWHHAARNQKG